MKGDAYVFINYEQAGYLGHIGWGFSLEQNKFLYGSTDHLWNRSYPQWHLLELIRYMKVEASKNNDFWYETGTEQQMLEVMKAGFHVRYHAYKVIAVEQALPEAAQAVAEATKEIGWMVLNNNCVHQTHRVLEAYGALLPCIKKAEHGLPKLWFSKIQSAPICL